MIDQPGRQLAPHSYGAHIMSEQQLNDGEVSSMIKQANINLLADAVTDLLTNAVDRDEWIKQRDHVLDLANSLKQ